MIVENAIWKEVNCKILMYMEKKFRTRIRPFGDESSFIVT